MNKRKILGTIIGLIFWSFCVVFFTYAYYDWKSDPTNIVLGIEDLSVECLVGANVDVSNIGPVLNYQDGVKSEFSINNMMADNMAIELRLDITDISDNLLTESLKYVLVTDTTGGTNYDYNNPIFEGDFSSFDIGSNLITRAMEVQSSITQNYQFIIYIDGNMYNAPNIQQNELKANLMIGNCGENAIPMDEMVYQAIYSEFDHSLTFIHNKLLSVGDTYNDKIVSAVYTGFEVSTYNETQVPWNTVRANIEIVKFENEVKPISTAHWFNGFTKLNDIDLSNLNTSKVTNMSYMFRNCTILTEVDVSNFDTSKVTDMKYMFRDCNALMELDLKNFNTSNVTNMAYMFKYCNSLVNIDLSNFDITKVKTIEEMFNGCDNLISLDLSSFNTNKLTGLYSVFQDCVNLVELNISNLDTSNVTLFQALFRSCNSLKELDLSNFDTSNAIKLDHMFQGCSKLTTLDLSKFNTSDVTDMSYMFSGCTKLTSLNLSSFETSNVTNMKGMFYGCSSLINLDLSNFDTNKVTKMYLMFAEAHNIVTTITIINPNITEYSNMFMGTANQKDNNGNYIGKITVNYTLETSGLVDSMIATKSSNSNVVKGVCIGDNCPIENT